MSEEIIVVKNVRKYFNDIKAVDDISFIVKEGEFFSFLGINGAGKSTTINMITGMIPMDNGEIYVNGHSIDNHSMDVKQDIGVVFQSTGLDMPLSVYDNLFFRGKLYNIQTSELKTRIHELSCQLEFKEFLHRPLNKLSGGQKRKIDLARALIHHPKIIILDEPTTGLDPKTRKLMWEYLNDLRKKEKLTIFLTTHYMEEAAQSDYVIIIDEGKIVTSGTPFELKEKYTQDYIKVYKNNLSEDLIKQFETIFEGKYKNEKEYYILQLTSPNQAKELIIAYPEFFDDFEVYKGDMDDVFINVTGKDIGD